MIIIDSSLASTLHSLLSERANTSGGIRDTGLLESALNAPFASFGGEDLYPTLEQKAARLCTSIISNHPFIDGNKRAGVLIALTFLSLNGLSVNASDADVIMLGLGAADGSLDYHGVLDWILKYTS